LALMSSNHFHCFSDAVAAFDMISRKSISRFRIAIKYNGRKSKSALFGTREHVNIVRDLDALLNSLVNIDRDSLVAILSSEAEAAERLASHLRNVSLLMLCVMPAVWPRSDTAWMGACKS